MSTRPHRITAQKTAMRAPFLIFSPLCRPRCIVRTFNPSHAAVLNAPYNREGISGNPKLKKKKKSVQGGSWNLNPSVFDRSNLPAVSKQPALPSLSGPASWSSGQSL